MIRALIVVGVRLYRQGLSAALSSYRSLVIAGEAEDGASALGAIVATRPDVVILDVALPGSLDLMHDLSARMPSLRVIAFAVGEASADVIACAEAGAAGYVAADASVEDLVAAVVGVVAGELICSPRIAHELFRRIGSQPPRRWQGDTPLTLRERQVLDLLRDGLSNKEIARRLDIAVSTVKNHVHNLLKKLGATSRSHLMARAVASRPWSMATPERMA